MNLIWFLLRAAWLNVAIAIFTALVSGGANARLIALINSGASNTSTDDLVWDFVATVPVAFIASVISQILIAKLAQDAVYNLRLSLSRGILASPLRHLEQLGTNRLTASLTEDVQMISNTFYIIPYFFVDVAVIIGCFIYLSSLSGVLVLIIGTLLLVAIASIHLLLNKAGKYLYLAREEEDRLFKHFRTITDGIKELKLNAQRSSAFLDQELQVSAAASRKYNISSVNIFAVSAGWGNLMFMTIVGLLVFGLPKIIPVSAPIFSAYVLTITYLINPFQSVLQSLPVILQGSIALDKIERIGLQIASEKEDTSIWEQRNKEIQSYSNYSSNSSSLPLFVKQNSTELVLEQVTYKYQGEQEDSHFTLGELNLSFHSGQLTFIVGGNGSGKSTLAKLITGLYTPATGQTILNGKAINNSNLQWYRQHFCAIFSDFYLFDRLLGIDNFNLDVQAKKYLEQLQLDHKVQVQNGIFSTTALSQGQRKRLALLTAYLEDRPIYLFDEWASDQDPFFRDIFYKNLLPNLKQQGKTLLVISHDDRYFHLADRIIKLDYGKVEY